MERRNGPFHSRSPQLRHGGGWRNVLRPTGTEDGQGRGCAQRSTETDAKSSPGAVALPAPVPQMMDNPMNAFRVMDQPIAEQVIAVPKIVASSCPSQEAREPQTAEQLVEVPTILYFVKQKVDIPVPRRGVAGGGTQGFLPGQSSSSIVHTPAGRGTYGGLQGFLPRHGTLKWTAEQIADIPVPGGLLFRQFHRESQIKGFFAFSRKKRCDNTCLLGCASAPAGQLIHAGCP